MSEPTLQPPPPPPPTRGKSWISVSIALGMCVLAAALLLALPIGRLGAAIVGGGVIFTAIVGFHYFLWGRWMTRVLERERDGSDSDSS